MPPEEKDKNSIVSYIAIFLWIAGALFQVGVMYATGSIREYIDRQDKELRMELNGKLDRMDTKLDRLIEAESREPK